MNASVVSALAALVGAVIGGLTSVLASWLTQRTQVRAEWRAHDRIRRQELYRDFIEEATKCYINALQHNEPDLPALGSLYAKISPCGFSHRVKSQMKPT
ncbi:LapA family protein [Paraburkholderia phymatum]|uniref:LapA family protein n=1 Tax=Paraburkholderia phymatum TaxID=148447 RepID=A0ACC6U838_9BURK